MDDRDIVLIETEQRAKSNTHQIDELRSDFKDFKEEMHAEIRELKSENKAIYDIASSVKVIATKVEGIEEKLETTSTKMDVVSNKVTEVEKKIIDVEDRPAKQTLKNINSIKIAVITAICTFLVTGILGAIIVFVK